MTRIQAQPLDMSIKSWLQVGQIASNNGAVAYTAPGALPATKIDVGAAKSALVIGFGGLADNATGELFVEGFVRVGDSAHCISDLIAWCDITLGASIATQEMHDSLPTALLKDGANFARFVDTINLHTGFTAKVCKAYSPINDRVGFIEIDVRNYEFINIQTKITTANKIGALVKLCDRAPTWSVTQ